MPTVASSADSPGQAPTRSHRLRKMRAILASGLVLGVGATMTLASWNDTEYAGGSIEAGSFTIQGSTTGAEPFTVSSQDNPHSLSFDFPESAWDNGLFPGATGYALFSVRAAPDSLGGTLQVLANESNTTGLGTHLTYGISEIADTTCNESTFNAPEATTVVAQGTAVTEGASPENVQLLEANAGSTVNYCLELHLPQDASNEAQGESAELRWEFLGTSVSE